ncbi:GGDEF domain-containing protein [Bacillus niameyensis]|uniref:GGDEF domain-containing protein n=1 Tax=Bacillus niameyensis TaxID=1522308 RepID=UPI000A0652FE|nr:diguanylate cyclase [Bacillus niameyensis]
MIIKDLFVNVSILVSILFFYSQISSKLPLSKKSPIGIKIFLGFLGGLLSIILMVFSIHVGTTLIDLRHIPTILLAFYGGAIPALIASALTIGGRFLIASNTASYLAIVISVTGTIFALYISERKTSSKVRVTMALTFNNFVFSIIFCYLVQDWMTVLKVLPIYWIISYLAAYLAFFVIEYIRRTQMLFNRYELESATDGLTGLNNKRKFQEVFNQLTHELTDEEQSLSLLYLDIDHFKNVNDTYGHSEGDVILKELGKRLRRCIRSSDIVSRNGGEEFTVLMVDCPLTGAVEIAEKIKKNVETNPFILNSGEKLNLTISIGVSSYQETTNDPTRLIDDADGALYKAKQSGRNKVCIANLSNH